MKSILRSLVHGIEIDFPGGFAVRTRKTSRGYVIIAEFPADHEASENETGQVLRIRPNRVDENDSLRLA